MEEDRSTNLEHLRAFVAVVERGGYAPAAAALGKSQSSVSYAIGRLEGSLGLQLLRLEGRRAVLTDSGQVILRRARALLEDARDLERLAQDLAGGWEAEIRVAADAVFPARLVLAAVRDLLQEARASRVEVFEPVLSGTDELLINRSVDLAVVGRIPPGYLAEPLARITMLPVASPDHDLVRAGRPLNERDLEGHRQIVLRDTGAYRRLDAGWLKAERRLTVSHFNTSLEALYLGLGFAWLPLRYVQGALRDGRLRELPLEMGGRRHADLSLVFADRDAAGPGVLRLAELIRERARRRESY